MYKRQEGNCVIEQSGHGTVTIGSVEKFITENAWEKGWVKPIAVKNERKESVGIIGAGPAGLACAEELRKEGIQVTIYDRYDRSGGLLIYGIPNFKLEKHVVTRRTELLEQSGIKFVHNFEVGKDASLKELRKKHNAILIATGVYKAREIDLPGSDLANIFPAMEFLTASNKKGLGDKVQLFDDGTLNAKGKDVVVIGGGDTAMDCVRTAIRQDAKSVKCIYRRDKKNMPGSSREVQNAEEEGIEFVWLTTPSKFNGKNKVESVEVNKIKLGEPDDSGRRRPEIIEGSNYNVKADLVIKSLGFDPEDLPKLFGEDNLNLTKWGTIKIDFDTMETSVPGVFAAGDIVRGASLVVWAIKDGRDVSGQILKFINSNKKLKEAETSRLIQQQKDRLDGFLTQTLSIEEKILETKDLKLLSELLAKVSRIKLKALQELTEEELRGDQTFAIFLEQCDSLIHQIQLQRIARNTAST